VYQNVDIHVHDLTNHKRIPRAKTKKALKEQLATYGPEAFHLIPVSFMGPQYDGVLSEADKSTTFILEGPDPYGVHIWYAALKYRTTKGKEAWIIE
jgi:hypothetical protein